MSNTIGNLFKFTIWGQSHAPAIGVTIEGIPAGTRIDLDELQAFLDRRRPGQNALSTPRREADCPSFMAGVTGSTSVQDEFRGNASEVSQDPAAEKKNVSAGQEEDSGKKRHVAVSCGSSVTAVIQNTNTRSKDYEELYFVPRPGHADYAAMVRFGDARDYAGGGQFSGRMTAPLCVAGGIALQILKERGISVSARAVRIGGETDPERMREAIEKAKAEGDSVGGIVECVIDGLPAGIGEPMFDGIENRIAQLVFGIPAVKGIEFGAGFVAADLKGSENNDPFETVPSDSTLSVENADAADILRRIRTKTNNHGGALGGMSSGMPVVFRAAFKPTPSIAKEQDSVDIRSGSAVKLSVKGRHDPCIVRRAVPVVEAAAAAAIYDLIRIWESETRS